MAVGTLAAPVGTAFNYQGRLGVGANPANGNYDFQFTLFNNASGGSPASATVTNLAVIITNGLFTTMVDFGATPFDGQELWLQIASRTNVPAPNPSVAFTPLSPRQPLTPAPYALTAGSLSGPLPSSQLGGTYSDVVTLCNPANNLAGHGEGLKGVDAATLGGKAGAKFWQLGGNVGTHQPVDFLGTSDNQPLEFKVRGARAFRLEPTTNAPNVIGGWSSNAAAAGVVGATIGGGGAAHEALFLSFSYNSGINLTLSNQPNLVFSDFGTIAGGLGNSLDSTVGTIGGGILNQIGGSFYDYQKGSTIGGGIQNEIIGGSPGSSADLSTIGGGYGNLVSESGRGTISGGDDNAIVYQSLAATIGGGSSNRMDSSSGSTIAGGQANAIIWNSSFSTVGGGMGNVLGENLGLGTKYSTIAGGQSNKISHLTMASTIGGGARNRIAGSGFPFAAGGAIAGGTDNTILGDATGAFVGAGAGNTVQEHAQFSTISGGVSNVAAQVCATVPGGAGAMASNYGQMAYASGQFGGPGDAQTSIYVCRGITTDATPTQLFLDGATMRMVVPNNSTWGFDIMVTGRGSDGTSAVYHVCGAIKNTAGTTALLGSPTKDRFGNVAAWDAVAGADNNNGALVVQVTGPASGSVRWVASVRTVEISY